MAEYVIIADSCMDLSKEQRKEFGIEFPILGSICYPDGSDRLVDVDWETISYEEFYRRLEKKESFKTGVPNPFETTKRVEEYFQAGKDVLAITLSGGMSGTYNVFLTVKKELEEKYPNRHFYVVDSRRYSAGIDILCVVASMNREKGMSIEENFKYLEEKKLSIHQIGILDNLFFLHRSGRISKTKAFFGTMAGVKPMADFSNETGMPAVLGNARGYKSSYKVCEEFIRELATQEEPQVAVVTQSVREEQAKEFENITRKVLPNAKILTVRMGQGNGVNVGPGLAAVFFGKEPVSKDCSRERELMAKILAKK